MSGITNKNLIIGILIVLVIIFGALWYMEKNKISVNEALTCTQLYELKKVIYWKDEIGQSSSIFNKDLNTCLAVNLYNNTLNEHYFGMVIDMSNDKTLLYYSSTPKGYYFEGENSDKKITCDSSYDYLEYLENGVEKKEYGCEKYEVFEKMFMLIKSFGFEIFDEFSKY